MPEKEIPGYAAEKRFALNVRVMAIDTITRCRTGRKLIHQGITTQNSAVTFYKRHKSNAPTPGNQSLQLCLAIIFGTRTDASIAMHCARHRDKAEGGGTNADGTSDELNQSRAKKSRYLDEWGELRYGYRE